ncbi:hypothetical protein Btru_056980 [Bulinus truncatus]|nr:hypothetical protein Btru_056980 [Bulinus truncatus]
MKILIGISFLLWTFVASDEFIEVLGPDRIEEFHVCVGTTAYIPLPLNVIARAGHESTIITLSFQRRHSEKTQVIATFNGKRRLVIEKPLAERLSISEENSGIYIKKISIDDSGIYIAQARNFHEHQYQLWTRTTNLTVHVRPIIHNNKLNLSQSEIIVPYNKKKHCLNITCGNIEYAGYPPVKFFWAAPPRVLDVKVASDDSSSSVQICSPFSGEVSCSIAGYSSLCTYDHVVKMHLELPGPPANSSVLHEATLTRDLVLMIILPILAVAIPVTILGLWIVRHLLRNRPRHRDQPRIANAKPKNEVDMEENRVPEQSPNTIEELSDAESQTERKEEISDTDDEEESVHENNNDEHIPHAEGSEGRHNDDDDDDDDDEEGGDEEDESGGEHQPLMDGMAAVEFD